MKRIGSLSHRRPYVYSFYLKSDIQDQDNYLHEKFPCMTHVFFGCSLQDVSSKVLKLIRIYESLGITLVAKFEDSISAIDVDTILQHYDTQLSLNF